MERQTGIVKKILSSFLLIVILGGIFSNYSLGITTTKTVYATVGVSTSVVLPSYLQGIGMNNLSCRAVAGITAIVNGGSVIITPNKLVNRCGYCYR